MTASGPRDLAPRDTKTTALGTDWDAIDARPLYTASLRSLGDFARKSAQALTTSVVALSLTLGFQHQ